MKRVAGSDEQLNPHAWIPYNGPEPYEEICYLCGTFSGAIHHGIDPTAASLPCPEKWPDDDESPPALPELTAEEKRLSLYDVPFEDAFGKKRLEIGLKCRECHAVNTYAMWEWCGGRCYDCGGVKGADRVD